MGKKWGRNGEEVGHRNRDFSAIAVYASFGDVMVGTELSLVATRTFPIAIIHG
jgi:hypothetical protein